MRNLGYLGRESVDFRGRFNHRHFKEGKKEGILDRNFNVVIPPGKYDEIDILIGDYFKVKKNGKFTFVDTSGNEMGVWFDDLRYFNYYPSLAPAKINGKWGFINTRGEVIIQPRFKNVGGFCENDFVPVQINKKWGFVNVHRPGDLIPAEYQKVNCFNYGLCGVKKNKKWGFIDERGKVIIPFQYDKVDRFTNMRRAIVEKNKKFGVINSGNVLLVPCIYKSRLEAWDAMHKIDLQYK